MPIPQRAGADTAVAAAEPPKYIKGRLKAKLILLETLLHISMGALMNHRWVPDSLRRNGSATSSRFANQQGALRHHDFVTGEIADLLVRGPITRRSAIQTDRTLLIVNSLNVVERKD